jgi:hypothetical protein
MDSMQVGRRVLARAAAKVGGVQELVARLDISARLLRYYIAGRERVPDALFLRAIDVILEDALGAPPATDTARTPAKDLNAP